MDANVTKTWAIAVNQKTSLYEVHAEGCKHLISSHLQVCSESHAETGKAAGAEFEAGNDYCFTKLGPCAK